ncbi:hypothetical protein EVAR_33680_1 [Eumeta japonica]|uniref:Uncharacterized protein n=1 Tax=Eumeta variegata TaxID=151549 RepID=A0A4C1VQJ4_EUMVA|nr:hypothetical protein EVAR_33680_1 [Eumeta japonica]
MKADYGRSRLKVVEMRLLRSMCGVSWKDRCRNSNIRERYGLEEGVVTRIETDSTEVTGIVCCNSIAIRQFGTIMEHNAGDRPEEYEIAHTCRRRSRPKPRLLAPSRSSPATRDICLRVDLNYTKQTRVCPTRLTVIGQVASGIKVTCGG